MGKKYFIVGGSRMMIDLDSRFFARDGIQRGDPFLWNLIILIIGMPLFM